MKMITKEIEKRMNRFPLYSQEGLRTSAVVLFKVFNPYGPQSWYVLEAGPILPGGDRELFVLSTELGEISYGYVMLSQFTDTVVHVLGVPLHLERDAYFSGTVADALRDAGIDEGSVIL